MKKARHNKIITGLPDTYGRGRIVGDYRRVALYGIDFLMEKKAEDFANCGDGTMTDDVIRQREEISRQYQALGEMKEMAEILRLRYLQAGYQRKGSRTVAVLRLPGSNQDTERCSYERWPYFYFP